MHFNQRIVPFLFFIFFLAACRPQRPGVTVIVHATVIDVSTGKLSPNFTVLLENDKILAVGDDSSINIPRGAKIVDATGKFLIPGLADMHIHLTGSGEPTGSRQFILPLLVANGITTVRDMGGNVDLLRELQREINSGERLGPQIFFTGPYLDGNPPSFQPSIVVETPAEADAAVRQLKQEGVNFIKVQSRLKPGPYFAIAEATRKEGIRFVGHVPDTISAAQASDAGQASIEHLTGILLACSSQEDALRQRQALPPPKDETPRQTAIRERNWQQAVLDTYSEKKAKALYAKFLKNHTWQVPTLPLLKHLAFLTPATDTFNAPERKYVPQNVLKIWTQGHVQALAFQTPADFAQREKLLAASYKAVRDMNAAGIPIMAGTDAAAPNIYPGFALHQSLTEEVEAGLTPLEALQSATTRPAEFLSFCTKQGAIAPGQRADLLLLDANPLENIHYTQKIFAVILKGKFLDRKALDALLDSAARFAAQN